MNSAREGILFVISGPAGSGKTTLGDLLLKKNPGNLTRSVTTTSRAPRPGEKNGVDYHFIPAAEFKKKIDAGEFFEWEENHGNYYGSSRQVLEDSIREGRDLLVNIDIRGALNYQKKYGDRAVLVFIVPPSPAVLEERMRKRGNLPPEELKKRLETANREYSEVNAQLQKGGGVDYLLVNDEINAAADDLHAILHAERRRFSRVKEQALQTIFGLKRK